MEAGRGDERVHLQEHNSAEVADAGGQAVDETLVGRDPFRGVCGAAPGALPIDDPVGGQRRDRRGVLHVSVAQELEHGALGARAVPGPEAIGEWLIGDRLDQSRLPGMPAPQPPGRLRRRGMVGIGIEARAGQQVSRGVGDAGKFQRVGRIARLERGVVVDEQLGVVGAELFRKGAVEVDRGVHGWAAPVPGDDGDGERGLRLAGCEVQRAADVLIVDAVDRVGAVRAVADVLVAVQGPGAGHGHDGLGIGLGDSVTGGGQRHVGVGGAGEGELTGAAGQQEAEETGHRCSIPDHAPLTTPTGPLARFAQVQSARIPDERTNSAAVPLKVSAPAADKSMGAGVAKVVVG